MVSHGRDMGRTWEGDEESIVPSWLLCSLAPLGTRPMGSRPIRADSAGASTRSLL